jgi:hypothetical protein
MAPFILCYHGASVRHVRQVGQKVGGKGDDGANRQMGHGGGRVSVRDAGSVRSR